jgi:hypothetical protein
MTTAVQRESLIDSIIMAEFKPVDTSEVAQDAL